MRVKIFIAIGAILLFSIGGFFVWKFYSQTKAPEETVNKTASPSPTVSATEGWQTYRNEEYGFEIKYPLLGKEYDFEYNPDQNSIQSKFLTIFIVDKNDLFISDKRGEFQYDPNTDKWLDEVVCHFVRELGPDALTSYHYGNSMQSTYPREDIVITNRDFALKIFREAYDYKVETVGLQEKIVETFKLLGNVKSLSCE